MRVATFLSGMHRSIYLATLLACVANAQFLPYNSTAIKPPGFSSSGPTQLMARTLHYSGTPAPNYGPRADPAHPLTYEYMHKPDEPNWNGYARVLNGNIKVHFVYYVDSTKPVITSSQRTLLQGFVDSIDQTKWFNILTKYYNRGYTTSAQWDYLRSVSTGNTRTFDCRGSWPHRQPNPCVEMAAQDVAYVIEKAITDGLYTPETNNIVMFINAVPGLRLWKGDLMLGVDYCGYHATYKRSADNVYIPYIVSGLPSSQCTFVTSTPNNVAADNLALHLAHELAEAITDPNPCVGTSGAFKAWCDLVNLHEAADKCEAVIANLQTLNGASYNVEVNGKKYILPSLWDHETKSCKLTEESMLRRIRNNVWTSPQFCLVTMQNDGDTPNRPLNGWGCWQTWRQNFRYNPVTKQVLLVSNGLCLGASGTWAGASVQQQTCGSPLPSSQKWTFDSTTKTLKPSNSNLCANAASSADGASITLQTCNGSSNQKWSLDLIYRNV